MRAAACDELIRRMTDLIAADPSLDLRSHQEIRRLIDDASPLDRMAYKRREDLLDAVICA